MALLSLCSSLVRSSAVAVGCPQRRSLFSSLVSWEVQDKIGKITLNSPKAYNALTVEMGREFKHLVSEKIPRQLTDGRQNVNAIILCGAGDKAFSAGGDFEWLMGLKNNPVEQNADLMLSFYKSFLCVRQLPVPVICALHGPAVGAGSGLALACDIRIGPSGEKKKLLGLTFAKLGIHTGMGASHFLPLAMTKSSAMMNEVLLTGKFLTNEECFDYGIVSRLAEDPKEEALSLAKEISDQNPLATRSMIQTIRQQQDVGLEGALQREAYVQAVCYNRNDWGEGVEALIERRDPDFADYHT